MGLCIFFSFRYSFSVLYVFLILLSAIFCQRQDLCFLFDIVFSIPLKKREALKISVPVTKDYTEDISAGEALVGITQHQKEGRFGPSFSPLGNCLLCNDYRSRLIFPSLTLTLRNFPKANVHSSLLKYQVLLECIQNLGTHLHTCIFISDNTPWIRCSTLFMA